jgi:hypothetical protein
MKIKTARVQALELYEILLTKGISEKEILRHLLENWLSGSESLRGLRDFVEENNIEIKNDDQNSIR